MVLIGTTWGWGGTLARVGFVVAVKAIFTGVNDKVAF